MFVVINIDAGSTLNELMSFMTQKTITFSVTDQISKLCDKNVIGERREISTQTEADPDACLAPPRSKKIRMMNPESVSPCSSATPSEPSESQAKQMNNTDAESLILQELIRKEPVKLEVTPDADDLSTELMQAQIMQALLARLGTDNENFNEDLDESDVGGNYPASEGSPISALRYKPSYASTKRGVCQVCNREVSLITTHRKRHAITHLGFKTLKCSICHKFFSRQDLASGHFKKDHHGVEFVPFIDTMSSEDEKQLAVMMDMCFPEEMKQKRKREAEANLKSIKLEGQ